MSSDTGNVTFLRVILMCLGRGSDPNAFQPNRDESMWWMRRDSLVRIVTSYLFHCNDDKECNKELILLFEEDYARMELKRSNNTKVDYPTEQRLVGLWRAAALAPGTLLERHGLSCRLQLDRNNPISTNEYFESKRELLDYLQRHCTLEFLRDHRLNSHQSVVLRKTNKQALEKVLIAWRSTQLESQSDNNTDNTLKHSRLESIYKILLQPVQSSTLIAAILHESCESELPCWDALPPIPQPITLCLFLGAVRDMHPFENKILQNLTARLVHVRLGPVPEFTSKILCVVAYHHFYERLGPAMVHLWDLAKKQLTHDAVVNSSNQMGMICQLHIVAVVPIASTQLSSLLDDRSRVLWCLVRVVVNTLWRSRLASAKHGHIPLENQLTFVFTDNRCIRMEQEEFVTSLAQEHKAAPSENQILKALCQKHVNVDFHEHVQSLLDGAVCLVDIRPESQQVMAHASCSSTTCTRSGGKIVALLRIRDDESSSTDALARSIRKLCKVAKLPIVKTSLSSSLDHDAEGATVVILQHLWYQLRLLPFVEQLMHRKSSKKRKLSSSNDTKSSQHIH